jgi:hypothetical protein
VPFAGPVKAVLCCVVMLAASSPSPAGSLVRFDVDASRQRPISPYIYGTNQPDWRRGPLWTLVRWGGNRTSTYNWETNASNAGADGGHQNDGYLGASDVPGEPVRRLAGQAFAAGASILVTVPILGRVAQDKRADGDVGQTPDYLLRRFYPSLPRNRGQLALVPDLYDNCVYQDEFVNWLESNFPQARRDAARTIFYALDNKPDLWWFTHARLHPEKTRYDEIVRRGVEYAAAIKRVAPQALVFGPVTCNWQGYDTLYDAPDAAGRDFLEFYLHEMQEAQRQSGGRLLDVLDVQWYPEARGGGVRITEDDAHAEVAAARAQAPRSLWDPNYVEDSWTAQNKTRGPIRLLPRLWEKINRQYRGTRLAISEYYFGGGGDISGALAEADVLGIFGREGLFAAALWHMGRSDDRFIRAAFAMFRNFDGQGGAFGNVGLAATTDAPERTSVYASLDHQQKLILVMLNKGPTPVSAEISLRRAPSSTRAHVYQLTGIVPEPARLPDVLVDSAGLHFPLPGQSITTLVLVPLKLEQRMGGR